MLIGSDRTGHNDMCFNLFVTALSVPKLRATGGISVKTLVLGFLLSAAKSTLADGLIPLGRKPLYDSQRNYFESLHC